MKSGHKGSVVPAPRDSSADARRSLSGTFKEEYEHVELVHLDALGGASASLALISTLVFAICIEQLFGLEDMSKTPLLVMYLCVSTSFSVYAICYSVLEYYYAQMFKGVVSFLSHTVPKMRESSKISQASTNHEQPMTSSIAEGTRDSKESDGISEHDQDHVKRVKLLVKEVRRIFSTLNGMRGAARNSMWLGLMCLVIATIVRINIAQDIAPDLHYSSSGSSAIFFGTFLAMVGPCWYKIRAPDLKNYCMVSTLGLIVALVDVWLIGSKFPSGKLVSGLILFAVIVCVPCTVLTFREQMLPHVREYVEVY